MVLPLCSRDMGHTAQLLLSVGSEAAGPAPDSCCAPSPVSQSSLAAPDLLMCLRSALHCSGNSLLNGCQAVTRPTTSLGSPWPSGAALGHLGQPHSLSLLGRRSQARAEQQQSPQPRHSVAPTKVVSLEIPINVAKDMAECDIRCGHDQGCPFWALIACTVFAVPSDL